MGEAIKEDADIFAIADLCTVWVEVTIYAKDLNVVKVGQNVTVRSKVLGLGADGVLEYLGPLVGEQTRTARGRVVVQNPEGRWRPGLCYRRSCSGRGDSTSSSTCGCITNLP